jgi:hypothetical protein
MDTAELTRQVRDATLAAAMPPWERGGHALVVVPDATRPLDLTACLTPLLEALCVRGDRVTILIGLGLHRPMTNAELVPLRTLGARFGAAIVQHDPDAATPGPQHSPHPLHPLAWEADGIVLVGLVEPHQYAGFSGGPKALAIGCAGRAVIARMHGLELLREPGLQLGKTAGNPFHDALWAAMAYVSAPTLALQIVPSKPARVFFGPLLPTYQAATAHAAATLFESHDRPLAWAHLPVEAAKAGSFYQASRAATYVAAVEDCVVEPGGWLLVEADCPEGIGLGAGELACEQAMLTGRQQLDDELDGRITAPADAAGGRQRAYVIARTLRTHSIALIGQAPPLDALAALGIPQFATLDEALGALHLDAARGATLPDVFRRVPRLGASG